MTVKAWAIKEKKEDKSDLVKVILKALSQSEKTSCKLKEYKNS